CCEPNPASLSSADVRVWITDHHATLIRASERERQRLSLPPDLRDEIVNETVVMLLDPAYSTDFETGSGLRSCVWTAANRVAASYGRSRPGRRRKNRFDRPENLNAADHMATVDAGHEEVDARDTLESLTPDV